jgi:hypothetical protein
MSISAENKWKWRKLWKRRREEKVIINISNEEKKINIEMKNEEAEMTVKAEAINSLISISCVFQLMWRRKWQKRENGWISDNNSNINNQ